MQALLQGMCHTVRRSSVLSSCSAEPAAGAPTAVASACTCVLHCLAAAHASCTVLPRRWYGAASVHLQHLTRVCPVSSQAPEQSMTQRAQCTIPAGGSMHYLMPAGDAPGHSRHVTWSQPLAWSRRRARSQQGCSCGMWTPLGTGTSIATAPPQWQHLNSLSAAGFK